MATPFHRQRRQDRKVTEWSWQPFHCVCQIPSSALGLLQKNQPRVGLLRAHSPDGSGVSQKMADSGSLNRARSSENYLRVWAESGLDKPESLMPSAERGLIPEPWMYDCDKMHLQAHFRSISLPQTSRVFLHMRVVTPCFLSWILLSPLILPENFYKLFKT